ncbi:MAG: undecaprenyl-diphosphate phosphatase [Paracoccaceae bacterium]|nr:undecaprenyl-diphosphate phosphatase [Paracoccaceae bacterium]
MATFHLLLIAVLQGVTEFLPVSSSGHLILLPAMTGLEDQGQVIDVAVHLGTLLAVMLYFWRDVLLILGGIPKLIYGRVDSPGAKLAFLLLVATVPVMIVGLLFKLTGIDDFMRGSVALLGWTMLGFGVMLWWSDRTGATGETVASWSLRHAVILGLWQALALIPGTSRSGICITGARHLGYGRTDATKLAMLMSMPTIIASVTLLAAEVAGTADYAIIKDAAMAAMFAFFAALAALIFMMRLLKTVSFTPYVIYRVLLGLSLLVWAYT